MLKATEDPSKFSQAASSADWKFWMSGLLTEVESHEINHTWKLVPRVAGRNHLTSTCFIKVKKTPTTFIEAVIQKVQLVSRAFAKIDGVEYSKTYAPVADFTSPTIPRPYRVSGITQNGCRYSVWA